MSFPIVPSSTRSSATSVMYESGCSFFSSAWISGIRATLRLLMTVWIPTVTCGLDFWSASTRSRAFIIFSQLSRAPRISSCRVPMSSSERFTISFEPFVASTMPGICFSICFVRSPFIGRLMIFGLKIRRMRPKSSGRSERTNWSPPETVTQIGTPSIERNVFSYSSRVKSGTFFCQMSQVLHRDGHVYVTLNVRLIGRRRGAPNRWNDRKASSLTGRGARSRAFMRTPFRQARSQRSPPLVPRLPAPFDRDLVFGGSARQEKSAPERARDAFEDAPGGDLRRALAPLDEEVVRFGELARGPPDPVLHLDLVGVSRRADVAVPDPLQHVDAVAAEAAREVVARNARDEARVDACGHREEDAAELPVQHAHAKKVAGPDDAVRIVRQVEEERKELGGVRAVRVHRDDAAEAVLDRPGDPVLVRAGEAPRRLAAGQGKARMSGAQRVGHVRGAVRRLVVDHEKGRLGKDVEHGRDVVGDRLGLTEGRRDDDRVPRQCPHPLEPLGGGWRGQVHVGMIGEWGGRGPPADLRA